MPEKVVFSTIGRIIALEIDPYADSGIRSLQAGGFYNFFGAPPGAGGRCDVLLKVFACCG
jgi:hypothetical protein